MERISELATPGRESLVAQAFYRALTYLPAGWLALFFGFVAWASALQGRLVAYGSPDPKYAEAASALYGPVIAVLATVVASVPVWLLLTLASRSSRLPLTVRARDMVLYLAGLFLMFLLLGGDVAGLGTWLAD